MKYFTCTILILLLFYTSQAQISPSFGLNVRQEILPVSKAKFTMSRKKGKIYKSAMLQPDKNEELILSNGWEMIEGYKTVSKQIFDEDFNTSEWYNATVPGTVLTTLVDQGVYPDPYIGLNNIMIPETLCRQDWWYRIRFDAPVSDMKRIDLLLNGINYSAKVWFNGNLLGTVTGAFIRGKFDISNLIKLRGNVLAINILPPNNPGIPQEQTMSDFGPNGGALCMDGPTFICSEGWDWIPAIRDRNIGLWQDVRLCLSDDIVITDPQVITDLNLPDTSIANIKVKVTLCNQGTKSHTFTLESIVENEKKEVSVTLLASEKRVIEIPTITLKNPRLWWPNGYGDQPLYNLIIKTSDSSGVSCEKRVKFGIRELSYDLLIDSPMKPLWRVNYSPTDVMPRGISLFINDYDKIRKLTYPYADGMTIPTLRENVPLNNFHSIDDQKENPYLIIRVNGVKIYCRGGNWGIDDGMKRCSRERLEPYVKLHAQENFNMIRNWTGESTEDALYELCDEYGIMVWNDFSLSTEWWSLRPLDYRLFFDNAEDIVKRYRNHPSIALWCIGNETYAPTWLEEKIQNLIAVEDGTRHYQGNSRYLNLTPSGPWCYMHNPEVYYTELARGFNTELGAPSVPVYETLCKFIPGEDRWPINDVWSYHDALIGGWIGWREYVQDIDSLGITTCQDAEEFCRRAQIVNYNSHKAMFEGLNSRLWNDVSGVLYWMSHPAWYSLVQQTYSCDYKTFGTYYGCKKACESIHIQWNIHNRNIEVVNITNNSYHNAKVILAVYNSKGEKVDKYSTKCDFAKNSTTIVGVFDRHILKELCLVKLILVNDKTKIISQNDYLCNGAYSNIPKGVLELPTTQLKIQVLSHVQGDNIKVRITNLGEIIATYVEMNVETSYGVSVLPVYISDSYFSILPGEYKDILIDLPSDNKNLIVKCEALNGQTSVKL